MVYRITLRTPHTFIQCSTYVKEGDACYQRVHKPEHFYIDTSGD